LEIFFFFFLILGLGFLLQEKKKWLLILFIVLGSIDLYKGFTYSNWYQKLLPHFQQEWGLRLSVFGNEWHNILNWINENIPEHEAILADIDLSAMILEKTDRPILIQPIYENSEARERVLLFIDAFYESEDSIYSLTRTYKFRHILYHRDFLLDNSRNSKRYLTLHTEFNPEWVSYRFHFFPESLRYFHKIVQTTSFTLYSLDSTLSGKKEYSLFFDNAVYKMQFREEPEEKVSQIIEHKYIDILNLYNTAVRFIGKGDFRSALDRIRTIHTAVRQFERSRAIEALCYQQLNEPARACSLYVFYLLENPSDYMVAISAFQVLQGKDRINVARAIYQANVDNRDVYSLLKKILNPQEFKQVVEQ
jgi:hypothetical protein